MDVKLLLLTALYLVSEVTSNDVRLGYVAPNTKKIYGEIKEADPALWKRTDDIIINTPHNEIISAVFITDLRDDKDGEASIESGGVGEKSVTIGLKSPSILRGYKFEIEVYGSDPSLQYFSKGGIAPYSGNIQYPRKF